MTKQARDFAAFNQIAAHIVLNPKGEHIATVQAHFGASRVTVTVYNTGLNATSYEPQTQHADGWGYDKFTAALAGMRIDGHTMADHATACDQLEAAIAAQVAPAGSHLANYSTEHGQYMSCFKYPGLRYLSELGYTVIQAA